MFIFSSNEGVIQNENSLIINKLKSTDEECLEALESICQDLLFDTKKYVFPQCSPHIVRLIQTRRNPQILDSATCCLRTAVEANSENVEMLMSSTTIEIISKIFNRQITRSSTEHSIHIIHSMSKYSAIALINTIDCNQLFTYITSETNSDIEKRLLSSTFLNITQVSASQYLISFIQSLFDLCNHYDHQIAFNSLSSLINIAKGVDSESVPSQLTEFLCEKLMDPKLNKVHNKIIEVLTNLAKSWHHSYVILQQNLNFERLLFSDEYINSRANFQHVLKLILNLLPYVKDLSIFGLSPHPRPASDFYEFSRKIQKVMKKVIIEKPLDVKTALVIYAVTLECSKNEKLEKQKKQQQASSQISEMDMLFGYDDNILLLNSDFDSSFYDNDDVVDIQNSFTDNDELKPEEAKPEEVKTEEVKPEEIKTEEVKTEEEFDEEIDDDLLMALISFSMISSNAPYILAVISYFGNSPKLYESYLPQLIKDLPVEKEFKLWFRETLKTLSDKLNQISMPRPLINLKGLSLEQINQLALEKKIPSYQFLFGGGSRICLKLLENEEKAGNVQTDISGISNLAFSLVPLLPMPCTVNEPNIEEFINLLLNPAPISIVCSEGKFRSAIPPIEPVWTLKGLIDLSVHKKTPSHLIQLMSRYPKLAKYVRMECVKKQDARPSNIAVLTRAFEHYEKLVNLNSNLPPNPVHPAHNASQIPLQQPQKAVTQNQQQNAIPLLQRGDLNYLLNRRIATNKFAGDASTPPQSKNPLHQTPTGIQPISDAPKSILPQPLLPRKNPNKFCLPPTTIKNLYDADQYMKKMKIGQIQPPPYPDYKNTSIFTIFCDKANSSFDVSKVQPEISLNMQAGEMKFAPLPNHYFTELFSLLKYLHDRFNVCKKCPSFVHRVHEQLSNPFGSIGRKSYAMTIIFKYPFLFPLSERILAYKLIYLDPYFAALRLISEFKSYDIVELRRHRLEALKLQVHRNYIFEDGCFLLRHFFAHKIEVDVQFHGENGFGKGPTREFLFNLSQEFARKKYGLFRNDSNSSDFCFCTNGLFPAPNARPDFFKLLGVLVAKAISMECNLDLNFNPAFFELARGKPITVEQINFNIANSLKCPEGLIGYDFVYPGYPDFELIKNSKDVTVNDENVDAYIDLLKKATIDGNVKICADAFVSGFNKVLPFSSLDIFSEQEIVSFIIGEKELITLEDLDNYCQLDGFTNESPEISMLFQTVVEMDSDEQKGFLKFVTGSSNLPIGGLKVLEPKMTVVKRIPTSASGISNPDLELPTSNTCNCTLKLPSYSSKGVLSQQLKRAISFGNCEFGRS